MRDYNTRVQSFPSNLIASAAHFETQAFFEMDGLQGRSPGDQLNKPPDVGLDVPS